MPKLSNGARGSDKQKRIRRTNAQLSSSKRKEQNQAKKSSALLNAFLVRAESEKIAEKPDLDVDLSVEELEQLFSERLVVENDTGVIYNGDDDNDDDDGFNEEGEYFDDNGDSLDQSNYETWMSKYISKIQERLKAELRTQNREGEELIPDESKWLIAMLKEHGFSIPWKLAPMVCSKLQESRGEPAYYCTVHVWLPEVQFGDTNMPHCGFCESNDRIGRHAFDHRHPARRITGLQKDEYVMTARYICHSCKDQKRPHTFRGYNPKSLDLMACRRKLLFPALLTHRSGVTMELAHLIRALVAAGVRPNCIAGMISEMHHRECHEQMLLAESSYRSPFAVEIPPMFSEFDDPKGYNGRRLSSNYVKSVYTKLVHSFREQADADTKKRDLNIIHIDGSYKFTKRLYKDGGEKMFDGLITVKNDFKEIRSQFVVFGESHDQIRPPLQALRATMDSYGQAGPKLAFTDNPRRDSDLLISTFDSLAKAQETYDIVANEDNIQRQSPCSLSGLTSSVWQRLQEQQCPPCSISKYKYVVLETVDAIDRFASHALDILKEREKDKQVMGLDCEWPVDYNVNGRSGEHGRIATIQLAYHTGVDGPENDMYTAVIVINGGSTAKLPSVLRQLLCTQTVRFVGLKVSGDVAKLKRDFVNLNNASINHIDLDSMTKRRGVVPRNNKYSLESLVEEFLNESLGKEPRLSDWSGKLQTKQLDYAALDAIKSLEVFDCLDKLPDLTLELPRSDIIIGTKIDIVASKGSIPSLAALCAEGEIVSQKRSWKAPAGLSFKSKRDECVPQGRHILVRITKVIADGLIMKGYRKQDKSNVSLGDLAKVIGEDDFVVMVDLAHLRHQYTQRRPSLSPRITERPTISQELMRESSTVAPNSTLQVDDLLAHDVIFETDDQDVTPLDEKETDESDDVDEHNYCSGLTTASIREINNVIDHALDKAGSPISAQPGVKLDAPPRGFIPTRYSVVMGDILHAIMRMRVSTKHECRKSYSAAIVRAFLEWDPERLREIKASLHDLGVTDREIEARLYYNIQWFASRVERRALPSHLLYWRVRSVLAYFGPKIDSVTGKPLFGNNEWRKANNLLSEILRGYYSDPPGVSFYRYRVDRSGKIIRDRKGFAILTCSRGTNDVENEHKNLLGPMGSWIVGVEMMDCIMADLRVRRNIISSRKYRPGFPKFYHCDPWLIDAIQNVVEARRGILLYPNWTNSSDLSPTPERHGFVNLPSTDLTAAIKSHTDTLDPEKFRLSKDMKYVATCIGTKLPYRPFSSADELRLYAKLRMALDRDVKASMTDAEFELAMCHSIIPYVDGVHVFPKTPVYIRQMEKRYLERKRIGAAVETMIDDLDALNKLNNVTATVLMNRQVLPNTLTNGVIDEKDNGGAKVRRLCLPPIMPRPNVGVCGRMIQQFGAVVAGNIIVREREPVESLRPMKRMRANDRKKRKERHCRKCGRPQKDCPAAGSSRWGKITCTFVG